MKYTRPVNPSDSQRCDLYAPRLGNPNLTMRANAILCLIHPTMIFRTGGLTL